MADMNAQALAEFDRFLAENVNQFLWILTWAVIGFGIVWLAARVIATMHRRAYRLTYAESGESKRIQPDFLRVDRLKRDAALARGERYDDLLDRRGNTPGPVGRVGRWSGIGATLAAVVGLFFSAVTTLRGIGPMDEAIRDLSNWEKLKMLVSQNQLGAVVCMAVIASNAFLVAQKLRKSE
jgi:hypothetical protein